MISHHPDNVESTMAEPVGAGPTTGGVRGVGPIHTLIDDYRQKLAWSALGNALLGVTLLLSMGGHLWWIAHPPTPEYFATTADGRLIPLIPISEPYVPQDVLLTWTTQAVTQAYTLDYVHRRQQLSGMRELFTAEGFRTHLTALDESGMLEAVDKRRLVTQVVATAPPVVTHQGVLANRYVWRLEVPIQVSYQGASSTSRPQRNVVEVLVVRVPTHDVPRGYAIHQLITRPESG